MGSDTKKRAEMSLLTLRKNQIDDYFMSRRMLLSDDSQHVYKIDPESLNLQQNLQIDLKSFLLSIDKNLVISYMSSPDIDTLKYGLFILRNFICQEKQEKISNEMNDLCLIDYLCSLLTHSDCSVKVFI